jgi:hypothetical protein
MKRKPRSGQLSQGVGRKIRKVRILIARSLAEFLDANKDFAPIYKQQQALIERGISKNEIISELTKSPHGQLFAYVQVVRAAAIQEAEFLAHLITYDHANGHIRDAKLALPVISMATPQFNEDFVENSLANLALLNPRDLLRAFEFATNLREPDKSVSGAVFGEVLRGILMKKTLETAGKSLDGLPVTKIAKLDDGQIFVGALQGKGFALNPSKPHRFMAFRRMVRRYLQVLESNNSRFVKTAALHRGSLQKLYVLSHSKPKFNFTNIVLFGRTLDGAKAAPPSGSIFEAIAKLKDMDPKEAAAAITKFGIHPRIAIGAFNKKIEGSDLGMAIIGRMSPTELVTSSRLLKKLGVDKSPTLRAAYDEALTRAGKSKANVLKTTKVIEALAEEEDEGESFVREKLKGLQEKQLQALGGIEGDWLVLGDKSGSMTESIELSRRIAATLAKMVKGKVILVFFDTAPRAIDATGKTYEQLLNLTKYVDAQGGTSIGCGLQFALESGFEANGIVVVSDGAENTSPFFCNVYQEFSKKYGRTVPVYHFVLSGKADHFPTPPFHGYSFGPSQEAPPVDVQKFDLRKGIDYYALPNLLQMLRTQRYGLIDQIMNTPLLTLDEVFNPRQKEEIRIAGTV